MTIIKIKTFINAPIQVCFDASRNIDLHKMSVPKQSNEVVIAGKLNGLMDLNDTVTWRARHLGFYFKMKVKITATDPPLGFTDEQIKGPFKMMKHQHSFISIGNGTEMHDLFQFEAPFGILGKWVEKFILKTYMQNLLEERNAFLKNYLEDNKVK